MHKNTLIAGASFACLAVIIGAFGAHALDPVLEDNGRSDTFETGVKYHIFHAVGLMIIGILQTIKPNKYFTHSALLLLAGILLFSGSLYVLSILNLPQLGAVTPFGGLCFIAGWIYCIVAIYKSY